MPVVRTLRVRVDWVRFPAPRQENLYIIAWESKPGAKREFRRRRAL